MLKKLLVIAPEDPETSSHVRLALKLAGQHSATVTGFTAVDSERLSSVGPAPAGAFSYRHHLVQHRLGLGAETADKSSAKLKTMCEADGVAFAADIATGDQSQRLTSSWRFQDLAVLPSQVWSPGFRELGDSETLLHFVAMGLRPLLVVPQGYEQFPKKVLVALSGSLDSAKAFKHFVQSRVFGDAAVHLVTVGEPKTGEKADDLLADAGRYAEAHGFAVTQSALPKSNNRVRALLDEAESAGTDAFVIGSSYRHFLMFTRFGSHAQGLLNVSKHPVFVSH